MRYELSPYESMDDFHKTVVRVAQATRFEAFKLWQAQHESCIWQQVLAGYAPLAGNLGGKPVRVDLNFAVVDGQRTLFWEICSQAFDQAIAEDWIKANCVSAKETFTVFREFAPVPMVEDEAGARRELEKVVYFIEANDREAQLVKEESRCDADITLDSTAYGVKIGELDGKPVVLKLLFATVNSRRIVFWMPGSKAFDFAMGLEWLEANSTLLATTESVVRSDASNFHNCVLDIDRMNEREAQAA